jgi:hypothetical protein
VPILGPWHSAHWHVSGGVSQQGQYRSLFGNWRQQLGSLPFQARSQVVDLQEAVVREQVSEVRFSALLLSNVGYSLKDSQSRPLLCVWDVEFPKLVLDPPELVVELLFKIEPDLDSCLRQRVLVLGPMPGDLQVTTETANLVLMLGQQTGKCDSENHSRGSLKGFLDSRRELCQLFCTLNKLSELDLGLVSAWKAGFQN